MNNENFNYILWTKGMEKEQKIRTTSKQVAYDLFMDLSYFLYDYETHNGDLSKLSVERTYINNPNILFERSDGDDYDKWKYIGLSNITVYTENGDKIFEAYIED